MPDTEKLDKLRLAVVTEKAESAALAAEYKALLAKMKAYQAGKGSEPTVEEFQRWRAGVARQIAERKLESGFGEL
jgi:hypothetical protein